MCPSDINFLKMEIMNRFKEFALVVLILILGVSCSHELSEEDKLQISSLEADLTSVVAERIDAEQQIREYGDGLIGLIAEIRLEIIKTTEALIKQRIAAIENGSEIKIVIEATQPDTIQAALLAKEIEKQAKKVDQSQKEAANARGLIGALAQSTVFTEQQTLAMLRQRYLFVKYGLTLPAMRSAIDVGSESFGAYFLQERRTD